jgi:hypothetical protein
MPITTFGSKYLMKLLVSSPIPPEYLEYTSRGLNGFLGVSLYTTLPDIDGEEGVQPSSEDGYNLVAVGFSALSDTATVSVFKGSEAISLSQVAFPKATGNWGTIVGYGIHLPVLTGDYIEKPLYWSALTTPRLVETNDVAYFSEGELKIFQGSSE